MRHVLPALLVLFACSSNSHPGQGSKTDSLPVTKSVRKKDLSDPTNPLTGKTETLELQYIDWSCACANWIRPRDYKRYKNDGLARHCIFIEPASLELALPSSFDPRGRLITVTGQFYVRADYPKHTQETEEQLDKARVFRYTSIHIRKASN